MAVSLVSQFDDIVACVNVLSAGSESGKLLINIRCKLNVVCLYLAFSEYLSHHIGIFSNQMDDLKSENKRLKGEKEAKDIQLKLSRSVNILNTHAFLYFIYFLPKGKV